MKLEQSKPPLGLGCNEGLGAWVNTDAMLPPVGLEVFATGWAFDDPAKGRYYAVVVHEGEDYWVNADDVQRSSSEPYRPTHWMLPPPLSA